MQVISNRIEYIDIAKGLAIVLVVMGHILQFDLTGESRNAVFNFIYGFHMPVFMALSGFVVGISTVGVPKRGFKRTLLRRIQQLAIPFFVWGLLVIPLLHHPTNFTGYKDSVINLLLSPDNGAWFLISLCGIHIAYIVAQWATLKLNPIIKNSELIKPLIFLILPLCWKVITNAIAPQYRGGITLYMPLEYAIMFYVGYLLKRNETFCFNANTFVIACLIFILSIPYYEFSVSPNWYRLITSIPATIILINISNFIVKMWGDNTCNVYRSLISLGKNSIMVYLLHFLIVGFTLQVIDVSIIPSLPLFLALVFVSFPIAHICVIVGRVVSENKLLARFLFGKYDGK